MKNQKTLHIVLAFLIMSFFAVSCTDWVEQVDPLISQVDDNRLDNEESILFVLRGVKAAVGNSTTAASGAPGGGLAHLLVDDSGFSDESVHDFQIKTGGLSPEFVQFTQDQPVNLDFYRGTWNRYHQTRFVADDLVERVGRVGTFENDALRQEALWWGNMVGGLMRLYLAYHWGWDQNGSTPGAVISTADEPGDLLAPSEIIDQAITKFQAALNLDPGATEGIDEGSHDRVIHSMMARAYLFDAQYSNAKTQAGLGLVESDAPFSILNSVLFENRFWRDSGRNRTGYSMHPRFAEYVRRDPDEGVVMSELAQADIDAEPTRRNLSLADIIKNSLGYEGGVGQRGHAETPSPRTNVANQNERLPLWERRRIPNFDGDFVLGYGQDKYTARDDKLEIIDWRENQLILAEVAIRDVDIATAVTHINNVRGFHGLTLATEADLNNFSETKGGASTLDAALYPRAVGNSVTGAMGYLIEERDKTLWMKGTRHVDQNRFDLWYLESFTWIYYPIPTTESKVNPLLKDRARDF